MSLNIDKFMYGNFDDEYDNLDMVVPARIKVVGVGGAGCNAVSHMVQSGLSGVDFVAINTDTQALNRLPGSIRKVVIGKKLTKGRGAGNDPKVGRNSAIEDTDSIADAVSDADMVFITAGMGGGTGTGAAPVVAQIAKESGSLVVAVVTTPFKFESKRIMIARKGLEELTEKVDSIIVIPNEKVAQKYKKFKYSEALRIANDVLRQAVQGISDIVNRPGHINVDFADVKRVLEHRGEAIMGVGRAAGNDRARKATREAIENPIVERGNMQGASALLLSIIMPANNEATMEELNEIAEIAKSVMRKDIPEEEKEVIFGTVIDDTRDEDLEVIIIATGFQSHKASHKKREEKNAVDEEASVSGSVASSSSSVELSEFERWRRKNQSRLVVEEEFPFDDSFLQDLERPAISRRRRGGGINEDFSH